MRTWLQLVPLLAFFSARILAQDESNAVQGSVEQAPVDRYRVLQARPVARGTVKTCPKGQSFTFGGEVSKTKSANSLCSHFVRRVSLM